jgi:hypothetical protein
MLINLARKHLQNKLQRLISMVQVKTSSTKGRDLASPEGLLSQWAHPRLARSQARANFVVQRPRPNRLTNRPYSMHI